MTARSSPGSGPHWPVVLWLAQVPVALALVGPAALAAAGSQPLSMPAAAAGTAGTLWLVGAAGLAASRRGRDWVRSRRFELLLLLGSSIVAFLGIGELGLRLVVRSDADGNLFMGDRHLHPFRPPVEAVRDAVARYQASKDSVVAADPDLGWAPKPGAARPPYAYDTAGIRVELAGLVRAERPQAGVLRVAIFGDSFTNGVDEDYDDTWGAQLERLGRGARPIEVLNFGVPAYGMDQALLRWRKVGRRFAPNVVVLGLQLENARRNTNLIRPLYQPFTDLPFSKPRFLVDGDRLRPINVPALPPDRLAVVVDRIDAWPLARYEGHYDPADFRVRPWHRSRLVTLAADLAVERLGVDGRPARARAIERDLALRILDAFSRDVSEAGARFLLVHLPILEEVRALAAGKVPPGDDLLRVIRTRFDVVDATRAMIDEARRNGPDALFNQSRHYSAAGGGIVARSLAARLGVGEPASQPGEQR